MSGYILYLRCRASKAAFSIFCWLATASVKMLRHDAVTAERGASGVVVAPIGFISDHLEVLYDLDVEARNAAAQLGLPFARAASAGTHPAFVGMIRELIQERLDPALPKRAVGRFGPSHDVCPVDCCLPGTGCPSPWDA